MQDGKYNLSGKIVLVMGLGHFGGGVDVAEFVAGKAEKVIVTDLAQYQQLSSSITKLEKLSNIEFHLGLHDPADFKNADIIVANPAVPSDNKFLQIARRAEKFITSQIDIFFELCPAKIIGITGANGKSTTTALTTHLLKTIKSKKVWLSGNIGNQPLLTVLDQIKPNDLVVLELSSFQIEQLALFRKAPDIALLTNLTPNHLDRYGTFENYCAAKENIFKYQNLNDNQPTVSIFNAEDKIASDWFKKYKNDIGRHCIQFSVNDVSNEIRKKYLLPGRANLSNLAAALAITRHFGVDDKSIINTLPAFKALPHRLELVDQINGVSWFNDSKATTPQSAITALDAFEQPIILIAGGYDKNIPFEELGRKISQKARAVILLGQTADKIAEGIKARPQNRTQIEFVKSLSDAVKLANKIAEPGDVVLLSPACASYDMFENYEQRGSEFTKLVQKLNI